MRTSAPTDAGVAAADEVEAIRRVQARYARAADTRDWALLRSVVTDDFDCDTGAGGRGATIGADALVERITEGPRETVHHALMPEIDLVSPTEATGVWAVHNVARLADGTVVNGYGHYHNRYVKVDGAWRLSRLRLEWLHRDIRRA